MPLPSRAQTMYATWWTTVVQAAAARDDQGAYLMTVASMQEEAKNISDTYGGKYAARDPIGLSQLFSAARSIANAAAALNAAPADAALTERMVATAPWSGTAEAMAAAPLWHAQVAIGYTDPEGTPISSYITVTIDTVLPGTAGDLRSQVEAAVAERLAAETGEGTPRRGTLDSVGDITLIAV